MEKTWGATESARGPLKRTQGPLRSSGGGAASYLVRMRKLRGGTVSVGPVTVAPVTWSV